jgi:TolB-like protein/class 3 adenylate cyclase/Flp pilus assembly protein TadD
MAEEGFKRKLAAILSADVEGYSRLMDEDEEATVRTLTAYRTAITDLVQQFRGRVVDTPGDNILAEFSSVVDAVNCAVEIQREIAERNAELSYNRKMEFRIGVNLGDVIDEQGRIYGDGVNIAARVESMADAGGICISGRTYDQVANKLGLEYENLGEHQVKNISTPIRVYRVLSYPGAAAHRVVQAKKVVSKSWRNLFIAIAAILIVGVVAAVIWNFYFRLPSLEPASVEKMAYPLPAKPSIAVLPFVNISGDPEQEYFSDGITEDLITDLSKISGLFIIARNSTFVYKGKPVKIRQVAEELGVRYVLEGSVRKASDKVRINAQLIDATTGHHLWAERYDGKLDDVFALQDKVTHKIVKALAVKLTVAEQEQALRKETYNIPAYEAYLKGSEYYRRFTPDDLAKAISYFEKAIELDPNYGRAHAAMALAYRRVNDMSWAWRLSASPKEIHLLAHQYLQMAMKYPTSLVHQLASKRNIHQRMYKEAIAEAEQAIALDANDPGSHHAMAEALIFDGRPGEAVDIVKKIMRLDPHNPAPYFYLLGLANFGMGQMEEAAALIERAHKQNPDDRRWARVLASIYGYIGRDAEAKAAWNNSFQHEDRISGVRNMMYFFPFKDPEVAKRFFDGLLKAGLPLTTGGSRYYKIFEENRLTGEEIKALVFGRKVLSIDGIIDRNKDGKATIGQSFSDSESGTSWVEDDMLCNQWQNLFKGLKNCAPVFRNPEGTPDGLDEYLWITDYKFVPFSPLD